MMMTRPLVAPSSPSAWTSSFPAPKDAWVTLFPPKPIFGLLISKYKASPYPVPGHHYCAAEALPMAFTYPLRLTLSKSIFTERPFSVTLSLITSLYRFEDFSFYILREPLLPRSPL